MLCEFKKDEHYSYQIYKEAIIDALLPIIPDKYWLNWAFGIPISRVELFEYMLSKDIVTNYTEVLDLLQIVLFMRQEMELKPIREKLLRLLLDSGELTSEQKGYICYNLANQVCMRDLGEAISLYKHSARYFPTYLTVNYWWKEMASMMFQAGHYYFSQKFYEKALTLTDDIENKCELLILIADTCLYQKNIEAAQSWLQKYFDICAEVGQAVPSKVHLLSRAYEFYRYKLEHGDKMYNKGDEWFNEGIRNYRRSRYKKSLSSFIIAWAYAIYDFEAIKNAMITALRIGDTILFSLIIETIRNLFGPNRINEMIDMVIQWKLPSKSKEGLLCILRGDDITSMLDA